jgi:hypothetical protein
LLGKVSGDRQELESIGVPFRITLAIACVLYRGVKYHRKCIVGLQLLRILDTFESHLGSN